MTQCGSMHPPGTGGRLPSWRNSLDRCMQLMARAHGFQPKLHFPSVFCCVSYNKLKLFSCLILLPAKEHGHFLMLLTYTALPSHSDQSLISHSCPSLIPWKYFSIAVTVTSVLYFQIRRMNCRGCEAV